MTSIPENKRVLIIDDNRAIHEDFRKVLADNGGSGKLDAAEAALFGEPADAPNRKNFQLEYASQGMEGVEKIQTALAAGQPFAMAFVDVRMPPGIDGIETTVKIWEAAPDTQIVICTAYSDYSWDEMVGKVGYSDRLVLLKKPFDNVEVLQLACALTEKWRLRQESQLKLEHLERLVSARTADLRSTVDLLQQSLTNYKRTEQRLRRSEERFRLAIQLQRAGDSGNLAALATELGPLLESVQEKVRFAEDAARQLRPLLRVEKELLAAALAQKLTPDLLARSTAADRATNVDYLTEEVPRALAECHTKIDRIADILADLQANPPAQADGSRGLA